MAKNLDARADRRKPTATRVSEKPHESAAPEHGLVGDIVFDPPLPPDELRRRFGFGISWEESLELSRQQLGNGYDLSNDVVFEPPLTPEERRRIGVDVTLKERWAQVQRRLASDDDGF